MGKLGFSIVNHFTTFVASKNLFKIKLWKI
mgnify:CR=1 FL=1